MVADEIDIFDEDELETFTWSFVSAPTDLPFKIDSSTGEILTVTSTQFGSFKILLTFQWKTKRITIGQVKNSYWVNGIGTRNYLAMALVTII